LCEKFSGSVGGWQVADAEAEAVAFAKFWCETQGLLRMCFAAEGDSNHTP